MQTFDINNLNPSGKTRLILKKKCQIEGMKKICLAFVTN